MLNTQQYKAYIYKYITDLIRWNIRYQNSRFSKYSELNSFICLFNDYLLERFSHQHRLMVSHRSLSKIVSAGLQDSSQYSGRSFISKSSCPFNNPLVTVPRASITIGINVTFMFHSFFNSLARSRYLFFFSLSFNFTQWTAMSTIVQVLFFLLIIIRFDHLADLVSFFLCLMAYQPL